MPGNDRGRQKRPPPLFTGYGHKVTARQRADWQRWADHRAQTAYLKGTEAALAGDVEGALMWLDRAFRIAPSDLNVAAARAFAYFSAGNWHSALEQLSDLAIKSESPRIAAALAVACVKLRRMDEASRIVAASLECSAPPEEIFPIADLIRRHWKKAGWCGANNEGVVMGQSDVPVSITLDDHIVARDVALPFTLPDEWVSARYLFVTNGSEPLFGAPINLDALRQSEGFVTCKGGRVEGWIWYPRDPEVPAEIILCIDGRAHPLLPQDDARNINRYSILRAARRFSFPLTSIAPEACIKVTDRYGRELMGSPVTPALRALLRSPASKTGRDKPVSPLHVMTRQPRKACLVIIPVYRGYDETCACLGSILDAKVEGVNILVINDASPDARLAVKLRDVAATGAIALLENEKNRGFVASVNAGLAHAAGRDVILLNNDALFFNDGIARLWAALHCAENIGTATPFSNHATIFSLPDPETSHPFPSSEQGAFWDRILSEGAFGQGLDVPTAHGFCMAIKSACLQETGLFREDLFAQGYGEENDFCLRAAKRGWRHIAATRVYVAHHGSVSFNAARDDLLARNLAVVEKLHPDYRASIENFIATDPLAAFRNDVMARAMTARWREKAQRSAILITHDAGGGVERVVQNRATWFASQGLSTLVIRPHYDGCSMSQIGGDPSRVIFSLPQQWSVMLSFLNKMAPALVEIHHMVGHAPIMHNLARDLDVSSDVYVHDYAWFCPRVTLLSFGDRYCGEPDLKACQKCVSRLGDLTGANLPVAALMARSAEMLRVARRVVAPCIDTAQRMMRHFDDVPVVVSKPNDLPISEIHTPTSRVENATVRICVVGAIGKEKGFDILLALARYAQRAHRALRILLVGHSIDDEALLETGKVDITGEYKDDSEALALIAQFQPHWGFLPSIWPETWCFALSLLMAKISRVAVFDIGAQAERARQIRESVVMPLDIGIAELAAVFIPCAYKRSDQMH